MALMAPGDTFMGLDLNAGGHLTHGSPVNMSGKWFKPVPYTVRREDQTIDMEEVARIARENKPKLIIAGGSAYPRIIDFRAFRKICDDVGAYLMVDMAHFAGLVAGGAHPSPFPHAHVVTTTTHKTLRGPRGGVILSDDDELAKKLNSAVFPGLQGGPHNHTTAAIGVALKEAATPAFKEYGHQIVRNAKAMAEGVAIDVADVHARTRVEEGARNRGADAAGTGREEGVAPWPGPASTPSSSARVREAESSSASSPRPA